MSGIKDLMSLQYWMDNNKKDYLERSLSNRKEMSRERVSILRELEIAGIGDKVPLNLGKKTTNH